MGKSAQCGYRLIAAYGPVSRLEQARGRLVWRHGARRNLVRQPIEVGATALLHSPGDALGGSPRDQVAGAAAAARLHTLSEAARADVVDGGGQSLHTATRSGGGLEHRHLLSVVRPERQ